MTEETCLVCGEEAPFLFRWPVPSEKEFQEAAFCKACAKDWWSKFKNTEAGLGLSISENKGLSAQETI